MMDRFIEIWSNKFLERLEREVVLEAVGIVPFYPEWVKKPGGRWCISARAVLKARVTVKASATLRPAVDRSATGIAKKMQEAQDMINEHYRQMVEARAKEASLIYVTRKEERPDESEAKRRYEARGCPGGGSGQEAEASTEGAWGSNREGVRARDVAQRWRRYCEETITDASHYLLGGTSKKREG